MSSLTFQLSEEKADRLADEAEKSGVAIEELLQRITEEFLDRKNAFENAARYVLKKNEELYRRLAR